VDLDSRLLVLSPKTTKADLAISFCTDSGKLIEHIYGFLKVVERILEKYAEKTPGNQSE